MWGKNTNPYGPVCCECLVDKELMFPVIKKAENSDTRTYNGDYEKRFICFECLMDSISEELS
jgi:hypothetical protein